MKRIALLILSFTCFTAFAQQGIMSGRVINSQGSPIGDATIVNTQNNQTYTANPEGVFSLENVCVSQKLRLIISAPGFKSLDTSFTLASSGKMVILVLHPISDKMLEEVVVSGSREAMYRANVAQKIEVISGKMFRVAGAVTMGEGLCFSPGLRVETNCQTCNFTQLRMNGLAGDYSQILVNSRPLFTGLTGLYGLDQFPPSVIERIEVIRGGGSVLYGANAIAGTVNIITRKPVANETDIELTGRLVGGKATGYNLTAVSSLIGNGGKSGVTFNINARQQQPFDANNDGFSEIPKISGLNAGINAFKTWRERHELEIWTYAIAEERFGGDNLSGPPELTTQSEFRRQLTTMGGADYKYLQKDGNGSLRFYTSGQFTQRRHYTGINGEDGWGNTRAGTFQLGGQWNRRWKHGRWRHAFVSGAEAIADNTFDEIKAFNYLIDQQTRQIGIFIQDDLSIGERWKLSAGYRMNFHNFLETPVSTPRLSVQHLTPTGWNFRAGYAIGFKPPQAFEADMHIAFAGGGISRIVIDPALVSEKSQSWTASVTKTLSGEDYKWEWSMDGFYTKLANPFVLVENGLDSLGNLTLLRTNGPNAQVYGISLSARRVTTRGFEVDGGITMQRNFYDSAIVWSEEAESTANFLRTPNIYGYMLANVPLTKQLALNTTLTITGPMYVPHFGGAPGVPDDRLVHTQSFFDWSLRMIWKFKRLKGIQADVGVRNILNSYQSDFDTTKNRDSNFIYGPALPRTLQAGLRYSIR